MLVLAYVNLSIGLVYAWTKEKKWGKICLFFADERYLRLSKICSLGIALPNVYYLYKKGFKYCN